MEKVYVFISECLDKLKNVVYPGAKRLWKGYGYYISLACLLTIFGFTAFMYRSRNDAPEVTDNYEAPYTAAMAQLAATAEPVPSPTPYSPSFAMPAAGEISREFSPDELIWSETLGIWTVHNGIDITTNPGAVIIASESGVISAAYEDDLYGKTIEITHDNGWISRYCSLETLQLVVIGNTVSKGDIISSAGSTAACEYDMGSHIHFELLHNGEYVEPDFE